MIRKVLSEFCNIEVFSFVTGGGGGKQFLCELEVNHPASRASFISFCFIFHYMVQSIYTVRKGSACRVEVSEISHTGLVKHCLMRFVSVPGMFGLMKSTHPLLLSLKSNVS